ncbi:MAG TPA: hypothetical protein VMT73_07295 [Anaerolineales bacterium]|nr:hypothetical protein [Anaerolineales bacterium]
MNTTTLNQNERPSLVTVIAAMTLASGIVNLFWGIIASLTFLATLVGIICVPFTILPTILGIFEIIYAVKLFSNPPQAIQPSPTLAWFEVACIVTGNLFSTIVGILALVFYNDLTVKQYFANLNQTPMPVPATPQPVLAPVEESPAPESPALPPVEPNPPESMEPDVPSEPKRPRKVAK